MYAMSKDENITKRIDQLIKLDMKLNISDRSYYGVEEINSDFNVHITELQCTDDQEWDKLIKGLETEYERRKQSPK
jgi:hypothetical protein